MKLLAPAIINDLNLAFTGEQQIKCFCDFSSQITPFRLFFTSGGSLIEWAEGEGC